MRLSILDQSPVPSGSNAAEALANSVDLAKLAEKHGYTRYWLAEHHGMVALADPAPEILVAHVAAGTKTIRIGSGGVLLPHYSPLKVAETFRVLHTLFPNRIDLGIARGPGASPAQTLALHCSRTESQQPDLSIQVAELLGFLDGSFSADHAFSTVQVTPRVEGDPEVWLLGSSVRSADIAAREGLPHVLGHFVDPRATGESLKHYRHYFRPVRHERQPRAIVALTAICADTEGEARRLSSSAHLLSRVGGDSRPVPTPEQALSEIDVANQNSSPESEGSDWHYMVGTPEQLHNKLQRTATDFGVDELMIVTITHDHQARRRSYQLLAEAFALSSEQIVECSESNKANRLVV